MEEEISVEELARALKDAFGSSEFKITEDSFRELLYIRIKGLSAFSEEEINIRATPILDEIESEFEEIILLDLD